MRKEIQKLEESQIKILIGVDIHNMRYIRAYKGGRLVLWKHSKSFIRCLTLFSFRNIKKLIEYDYYAKMEKRENVQAQSMAIVTGITPYPKVKRSTSDCGIVKMLRERFGDKNGEYKEK